MCRSPVARISISINEWRASCSSIWSKKPIPVAILAKPVPSRSTLTSMPVSLVLRETAPLRMGDPTADGRFLEPFQGNRVLYLIAECSSNLARAWLPLPCSGLNSTSPAESLQSKVPPAPPNRTETTMHSVGLVRVGLRDMTVEEDLGATMVSGGQFARHVVQAHLEIVPLLKQGFELVKRADLAIRGGARLRPQILGPVQVQDALQRGRRLHPRGQGIAKFEAVTQRIDHRGVVERRRAVLGVIVAWPQDRVGLNIGRRDHRGNGNALRKSDGDCRPHPTPAEPPWAAAHDRTSRHVRRK